MENHKSNWLCIYIFINPPVENVLHHCLFPIAERLIHNQSCDKFFFIRYGEGGYHIRFRIHFKESSILNSSRILITDEIKKFITDYAIVSSSTSGDSVFEKQYVPEYKRYGGFKGIQIAEQLFYDSSTTIIKIIKLSEKWNYNAALYTAIWMNYILINSLVTSQEERYNFYLFNYNRWLPYSYRSIKEKISIEEMGIKISRMYDNIFNTVKSWLIPLVNRLNSDVQSDPARNSIEENWIFKTRQISTNISKYADKIDINKSDPQPFWSIFDAYVHMNNNRLGIRNQDESLISFLILKSINYSKNGI